MIKKQVIKKQGLNSSEVFQMYDLLAKANSIQRRSFYLYVAKEEGFVSEQLVREAVNRLTAGGSETVSTSDLLKELKL